MKNGYEVRGEVTAIFLKRKDGTVLETLVDTSDIDLVSELTGSWYAHWSPKTKSFYVVGNHGSHDKILLHRWVMGSPPRMRIDHQNHNTLDNLKSNLSIVTQSENMHNPSGKHARNTSGFRGVSWKKDLNKWVAQCCIDRKNYYLGLYTDIEEAKRIVEEFRRTHVPYRKVVEKNVLR